MHMHNILTMEYKSCNDKTLEQIGETEKSD